jgi:uncharacterized phage infection (PIP) family protein YhgE
MAEIFAEQLNSRLNEFQNLQDSYRQKCERLNDESNKANGERTKELDDLNDQLKTEYEKLVNVAKQILKSVMDELDKRIQMSNEPDVISENNNKKRRVQEIFNSTNSTEEWRKVLQEIGVL